MARAHASWGPPSYSNLRAPRHDSMDSWLRVGETGNSGFVALCIVSDSPCNVISGAEQARTRPWNRGHQYRQNRTYKYWYVPLGSCRLMLLMFLPFRRQLLPYVLLSLALVRVGLVRIPHSRDLFQFDTLGDSFSASEWPCPCFTDYYLFSSASATAGEDDPNQWGARTALKPSV